MVIMSNFVSNMTIDLLVTVFTFINHVTRLT